MNQTPEDIEQLIGTPYAVPHHRPLAMLLFASVIALLPGGCHSPGAKPAPEPAAEAPTPNAEPTAADARFPAPSAPPTTVAESVVVCFSIHPDAAAPIFRKFEQTTGIVVIPRDSSGDGIGSPKCGTDVDVFWTTDPCQMFELAANKALVPYDSESGERHAGPDGWPASSRATDHTWYGLGRRLRVLAYNPAATSAASLPVSWMDMTDPRWRGRIGLARPSAPGNATRLQLAAMYTAHGPDFLQDWSKKLVANDVRLFDTDDEVVAATAAGQIDLGITSSDSAIRAASRGLGIRFRLLGNDGTVSAGRVADRTIEFDTGTMQIPQMVAIATHAPHEDAATVFVDFLLSNEVEALQAGESDYLVGLDPAAMPAFTAWCDGAGVLGRRGNLTVRTAQFQAAELQRHHRDAINAWMAAQPAAGNQHAR